MAGACGARSLGLILPGRAYTPAMPLLDLVRRALLQHGYAVRQAWWDAQSRPPGDPDDWVGAQTAAALATEPAPPSRVVVVGKSLGTRASAYAAAHGYDAVWLTPLLGVDSCVAGIRANRGRQLLVGGLGDELWDTAVAAGLAREGCRVLEIRDADHALSVEGDVVRSAEIHVEVARAIEAFLGSLERP